MEVIIVEVRTVQEGRIYILVLNPINSAAEDGSIAAISDDYNRLVGWYKDQFASESWEDGQWYKTFKKGSPIEWYNPCFSLKLNDTQPFGHGIHDEWILLDNMDIIRNRYFCV